MGWAVFEPMLLQATGLDGESDDDVGELLTDAYARSSTATRAVPRDRGSSRFAE
jgi:hypothetical protein